MRLTRVHIEQPLSAGSEVVLPESAAAHLVRVLRLGVGDACVLFNGDGHDYAARIVAAGKRELRVAIDSATPVDRESPLQLVLLLCEPGRDFHGGEFVMTEQRPRMQSRPMVLPLRQGDGAVIAVHHRPVQGTRGVYRVTLRHGVNRVHAGQRHTAGIIFHDAR